MAACPSAPTGDGSSNSAQTALEEVLFTGGGVTLAGTLALPDGEGPHPAIVITHGSEPGSRHGYGLFAETFLEQGLAVLRYDKRGVGDSEGTYIEAPDLRQPCADLLGAVAFLRGHAEIDADHIGVFGASQGGWVAPMAASMSDHIKFVCLQSGPSVSPFEQNLFGMGNQLLSKGLSRDDVAFVTEYRRAYWGYLISGNGFDEADRLHGELVAKTWYDAGHYPFPFVKREVFMGWKQVQSWAIHNSYEPRLTLERVRVPLLAVFGSADTAVPVERSVVAFRTAFAMSGNEGLTIKVFEGADHGIRIPSENGSRQMAPGYVELMGEWAARQAFDIH